MVNWIFIRDAHPQNFTHIHDVTSVCRELKCKSRMSYNNFNNWIEIFKWNICWSKGHQCYFFGYLILSFCLPVICKSLRKNSGQSIRGLSDHWPPFLVFKASGDNQLMNKFIRPNFGGGLTLKNFISWTFGSRFRWNLAESLGNGAISTQLFFVW